MGYGNYYPPYVPVAEKRAKADKKLKQLKKKNPDIRPVRLEGKALARSWWGKAWNKNLERYADYSNRIGRGRSYVRHNAVLDLQISPGLVTALVQGSSRSPYEVEIHIKEISKKNWKDMITACQGGLESLQELLTGRFPKKLEDVFTARGQGLFPTPEEINFSCSCPDWASMCKHVAATLYGVGVRLDEDPSLFFTLRKRDVSELISSAVAKGTKTLLDRAENKSDRVLEDTNLSDVFGIDMDEPEAAPATKAKPSPKSKKPARAKPTKTKKADGKKAVSSRGPKKTARAKSEKTPRKTATQSQAATAMDAVADIIAQYPKGAGVADIRKATGFEDRKIYNIVHQLKEKGRIQSAGWGKYMAKTKPDFH